MEDDVIFYADNRPYKEVSFSIPARRWKEFTGQKAFGELKAYAEELAKSEWAEYCGYEHSVQRETAYGEALRDVYHRLNELRKQDKWMEVLITLALVMAAIAITAVWNMP